MISTHSKFTLLWMVAAIGIGALIVIGPIAQDPGYHVFADTKTSIGIENFWNVISNLPFLAVGIFGLVRYPRLAERESRIGYGLLCLAVALVSLGSAYYHHAPSNASLLWDRLPMTVAFMALFGLLLGERVVNSGKQLILWVLIIFGVGAALYWAWTEAQGRGDLRPYVLVQFLPIVLMPLILLLFPTKYLRSTYLLYAFALYFVAKALEHFDWQLQTYLGFSGHPLKHVVAAAAVLCIVLSVPVQTSGTETLRRPA